MKVVVLSLSAIIFWGCSASAKNPRDRLMDEIESRVSLPKGAHALRDYARYYAFDDKSRVWVVYTLPGPPPTGHEVCKEMDGAVPPEKWRVVPCAKESPEESYLPAGQRRWMSDYMMIPLTPDTRGCEQITLTYDAHRNVFVTEPSCSDDFQAR
jgi:hypothetical protein